MTPEKIAYQKLQALLFGHNISDEGGIDRIYSSLRKSTAHCKTLCVSANVKAILVPVTFVMQFSQGSSRDLPTVVTYILVITVFFHYGGTTCGGSLRNLKCEHTSIGWIVPHFKGLCQTYCTVLFFVGPLDGH
jgi:hypothetical protein